MNNLQKAFLFTSCVSAFGDALLYLALPVGLGLTTGKVEDAITLFLIPAIFMFASSYVSERFVRPKRLNLDYGYVLISLALIELIISVLCILAEGITEKKYLMYLFVAIYSFGKEGLPKIYYNFEVYKFFFSEDHYSKVVAKTKSLVILGGLLGMCSSAVLIELRLWEYSLLVDSFTFLALGLIILRGSLPKEQEKSEESELNGVNNLSTEHKYINFIVPFYIFISSLFWPFLPLINQRLGVASISHSILLLAAFKLPGIIAGFKFEYLKEKLGMLKLLYITPWLALFATLTYMLSPSLISYLVVILTFSLVESVYWPADYSVRDQLNTSLKIKFNKLNLRLFALFQGLGCLIGYAIFHFGNFQTNMLYVFYISFTFALLYLGITRIKFLSLLLVSILSACNPASTINIVVPNINDEIRLSNTLTYSETIITNVTSAHLLRIDKKLNLAKEVLGSVEKVSSSKFILNLNEDYRTFRGEEINASDVVATFKYYIQNLPDTMRVLNSIKGSVECNKKNCKNFGVKKIGKFKVQVELKEPNPNFLNDLISPVFVIIKEGKPLYEKVGECTLPYQTGRGHVSKCTKKFIEITHHGKKYKLSKESSKNGFTITPVGKGNSNVPSLTSMFFIKNPTANAQVSTFMRALSSDREALANHLKVAPSKTLTSSWLGFDTTILKDKQNTIEVPAQSLNIVIAKSIPEHQKVTSYLESRYPQIDFKFNIVPSQNFFQEASKADLSLLWLTPGYFDFYDLISIFDCDPNRLCWYNFEDIELQKQIRTLRRPENRYTDQATLLKVEKLLQEKGYLAPIGLLNWWLKRGDKFISTHPAGLFMIDITELDYD
ncbi:MAG: hypothetical protein CME64_04095 [Halobacteriovoraceae bacterium]|nr:hypothetical protein [Halobacteriovoraceae bacterium]|tara:strand:+ start:96176 stop:98686 length:2511 start_codon:yes stop_codon:yes gene_type:complete